MTRPPAQSSVHLLAEETVTMRRGGRLRMEKKRNGAIISTREKGEPARHSSPLWSVSVLSDFAAPALLPITPQLSTRKAML